MCVPVCVCPCMCALVGIITRVYARVSVWSGCVCLCPSVHYEVVGVVNTYVCASECPGVYVYLFVSVHACANGRGRNACLECVCVPVIVVRPPKCNHLSTEGCCLLGNSLVNFYCHVLN